MTLNNPRGFSDEVNKATLADPRIAQNEAASRRRSRGDRGGLGGWRDRIAVFVGLAVLVVVIGGFFWNLYGP